MRAASGKRRAAVSCLVAICAALLVACAPEQRSAIDGVLVFDEEVTLVRGERTDSVRREFAVDGKATFVAIVEETDVEVKVRVSHQGAPDEAPASVEVDSQLLGAGTEIAALDAPRGSRLTVLVESGRDFNFPTRVRLKIRRFDAQGVASPPVSARVAAYRAWTAATDVRLGGDELREAAVQNIDKALAHFEGPDGDRSLAAWGRVIRARIHNRQFTNLTVALRDVRQAAQAFDEIGAARNAGRARILEADTLLDISTDIKAKNPSAEDAAREALELLSALAINPALSPFERVRATNYLGVQAFNIYDWPRARATWQTVVSSCEAIGDRLLRRQALENLGVLANEEGDYRTATKYSDLVIDEFEQIESVEQRIVMLYNAAGIDINAGNLDRAIERLLKALELTRQQRLSSNEARVLHGLGRAYRARGDNAQAAALLGEGLKLRRTMNDANGLVASLRQYGSLARDAGDFEKALALHGEANSLAMTPDTRVHTLLDLASDYVAASDYRRAISTSREALAVRVVETDSNKRAEAQLALAEALLSQPRRTPKAIAEGAVLAQSALDTAILRVDATMEFSARRLLAQSHVARGDLQRAREEYERAIALIFKYRSKFNNPDLQVAALAQEQQTFRGYVDLLMINVASRGANRLLPATAAEEEALRTLEWARALNFDSTRFAQLDSTSQARLDELLTQMAGKRVRIAALLERSSDSAREIEILQLDIAKLRAEVDRLRASARRIPPVEAESHVDTPPWPTLPPGVTQLSYAVNSQNAYLWVRDASGVRTTMLAASADTIARALAEFATAIRGRKPDQVEAALSRLSSALLPAGVLAKDSGTLEIVAEGQIASVPFAALRVLRAPSMLAERGSIVMIGSLFEARARPQPARPRPFGFVALANDSRSSGDTPAAQVFPALNNAGAEVKAIASQFQRREPAAQVRLLLGAEGSAASLKKTWEGGVDVIHFATHGLADLRQPLASLLLLPALDATGAPTYLTAGQVQEWRGDADLVYLSACETAVGPGRFAEGLPGLQRAFLRAGARGVVATLWPVEDVYASQFAVDFYRRYTAGMPASQALSETQRAWMQPAPGIRESDLPYRRMTAWAHAYYAQ
jgi:CHAT domain-containing protein